MSGTLHDRISALVEAEPGVTMASLLERTEDAVDGDILAMIAARKIYVDLEAAFLGETERVRVFRSKAAASVFNRLTELESRKHHTEIHAKNLVPGSTLRWDNKDFTVLHTSNSKIYLRGPDGGTEHYRNVDIERFIGEGLITDFRSLPDVDSEAARKELEAKKKATEGELFAALEREAVVLRILAGEKVTEDENEARKHRNWVKWYQEEGLAGLIFTNANRGNRNPRLDTRVLDLAIKIINGIEKPGKKNILTKAYGDFRNACGDLKPCTYKTFWLIYKAREGPKQTEKIEGSRAAYQQEEPVDGEYYTQPVNGDRPWQFAHIDHTVIDLELRHSTKRHKGHFKSMGKAWITLMIDAYSRRVLAYYISYDPPSKVAVMMVVRECVRRFSRLPECIVVDRGSEFESEFFETVLSRYNCDVQWRPPSKPRYGAIIERFIKTMNLLFVHLLEGNTKVRALKLRLVTKKVDPKNLAVWNLLMLDEEMEKFFYEEYDTREHGSLGQSPRDAYEDSIKKYKLPGGDGPVPYNENFVIDILPTTPKGTAKAVRSRGVKIWGIFYTSRALKLAGVYGQQVEVRYDPWDASVAYAYIKGRWETLNAPMDLFNKLKNRSHKEIKALTQELRQEKKQYGRNFNARAMELAEKHAPREKLEELERQRQRDAEKREAARRTGRHLSVVDFAGGPDHEKSQAESAPRRTTAQAKRAGELKTFGTRRRRAA